MAVDRREQPLRVEIPKDDAPRLGRVSLIALIGFGIGAFWPTLAGVKLVPTAPTQTQVADVAPEGSASARAPSSSGDAPPQDAPNAAPASTRGAVSVGPMQIASCRDGEKKAKGECGDLAVDPVLRPGLVRLGACEGAARISGALSLGFELDMEKGRIERIASGKSTSLEQKDADLLVECAKTDLIGTALDRIEHAHQKYAIFYRLDFKAMDDGPGEEPEKSDNAADLSVTPASGRATVAWDVALVRAAPSRDEKVVARILSGTRVVVTGRRGDWYQIKYDSKGNVGFVYRTAIGM